MGEGRSRAHRLALDGSVVRSREHDRRRGRALHGHRRAERRRPRGRTSRQPPRHAQALAGGFIRRRPPRTRARARAGCATAPRRRLRRWERQPHPPARQAVPNRAIRRRRDETKERGPPPPPRASRGALQHHRTRRNDRNVEDAIRCRSRTPRVRQRHRSRHPPMRRGARGLRRLPVLHRKAQVLHRRRLLVQRHQQRLDHRGDDDGSGDERRRGWGRRFVRPGDHAPSFALDGVAAAGRGRIRGARRPPPTRDTGTAQPQTESPISVDGRRYTWN